MDASKLIAKALEQREAWVDLGEGKRIKLRRPPAAEMFAFGRATTPGLFLRTAVGWEGFTEADVLGAAVGSDSTIAFDVELWVVLALDKIEWIAKVSEALVESIKTFLETQDATAKN